MSGTQARLLSMVLASAAANAAFAVENVTSGPETDYQASVIRSSDDGARIVAIRRIPPIRVDAEHLDVDAALVHRREALGPEHE